MVAYRKVVARVVMKAVCNVHCSTRYTMLQQSVIYRGPVHSIEGTREIEGEGDPPLHSRQRFPVLRWKRFMRLVARICSTRSKCQCTRMLASIVPLEGVYAYCGNSVRMGSKCSMTATFKALAKAFVAGLCRPIGLMEATPTGFLLGLGSQTTLVSFQSP